jgi:hypothetical protein
MTDLRHYVEDNRGLLKKIELCIPGFRGYRLREDIRTADSILRSYLADQIETEVQKKMNRVREIFSKTLELDLLSDIGEIINLNKRLMAKIRHTEQGYSGISPQYKIGERELNRIYDFDYKLIESVKIIQSKIELLTNQARTNDIPEIKNSFFEIRSEIEKLDELFEKRQFLFIEMIDGKAGV